jgi:hypothetical protein
MNSYSTKLNKFGVSSAYLTPYLSTNGLVENKQDRNFTFIRKILEKTSNNESLRKLFVIHVSAHMTKKKI